MTVLGGAFLTVKRGRRANNSSHWPPPPAPSTKNPAEAGFLWLAWAQVACRSSQMTCRMAEIMYSSSRGVPLHQSSRSVRAWFMSAFDHCWGFFASSDMVGWTPGREGTGMGPSGGYRRISSASASSRAFIFGQSWLPVFVQPHLKPITPR